MASGCHIPLYRQGASQASLALATSSGEATEYTLTTPATHTKLLVEAAVAFRGQKTQSPSAGLSTLGYCRNMADTVEEEPPEVTRSDDYTLMTSSQ